MLFLFAHPSVPLARCFSVIFFMNKNETENENEKKRRLPTGSFFFFRIFVYLAFSFNSLQFLVMSSSHYIKQAISSTSLLLVLHSPALPAPPHRLLICILIALHRHRHSHGHPILPNTIRIENEIELLDGGLGSEAEAMRREGGGRNSSGGSAAAFSFSQLCL